MKILSSSQIYQADQATIKNTPISSTDLMERAASKCVDWILGLNVNRSKRIHVFCGRGNNGGDGLVISRLLIQKGFQVITYDVNFSRRRSPDCEINLKRLIETGHKPIEIDESTAFPKLFDGEFIIDAIFGIGLTRAPEGVSKKIIEKINQSGAEVIAIDIPSGLFAESSVTQPSSVIRASHTLTFQHPKLAFFLPENHCYIKNWVVLDIGLDQTFIDAVECQYTASDKAALKGMVKRRERFSHKGTYGHSLLIGGSFGKIGAVILASKAALKIGSGLVSVYIPKCGYHAMQSANPEIMVEVDDENYLEFFNFKTKPVAIGIGMGLGLHLKTKKGFVEFLRSNKIPLVIDADGLNIIAEHQELSHLIKEDTILTPHPKEFERLVGAWKMIMKNLQNNFRFRKNTSAWLF